MKNLTVKEVYDLMGEGLKLLDCDGYVLHTFENDGSIKADWSHLYMKYYGDMEVIDYYSFFEKGKEIKVAQVNVLREEKPGDFASDLSAPTIQ